MQRRLSIATRAAESTLDSRQRPGTRTIVDHPIGPDWVHPSIVVRDTHRIGLGLVAVDLIPRGSQVILFGGTLMTWREVTVLPDDMQDIPYQVADDIFFGVVDRDDIGIGERINHSCDPNTGFVSEMKLVALRDILPGEDVTMDYGTCSSLEEYRLVCQCGEKTCRGVIRGTDWQNLDMQRRLGQYFQPYLREKMTQQRRRGLTAWLSYRLRSAADLLASMG